MPKKKSKELFTLEETGRTTDGKTKLYCGYVGGYDLGTVQAKSAADAKKKLKAHARKLLK